MFANYLVYIIRILDVSINPTALSQQLYPLPGLPSCGLCPHSGRPGRGEWPLSIASGTPLPCGSIIGQLLRCDMWIIRGSIKVQTARLQPKYCSIYKEHIIQSLPKLFVAIR